MNSNQTTVSALINYINGSALGTRGQVPLVILGSIVQLFKSLGKKVEGSGRIQANFNCMFGPIIIFVSFLVVHFILRCCTQGCGFLKGVARTRGIEFLSFPVISGWRCPYFLFQ